MFFTSIRILNDNGICNKYRRNIRRLSKWPGQLKVGLLRSYKVCEDPMLLKGLIKSSRDSVTT